MEEEMKENVEVKQERDSEKIRQKKKAEAIRLQLFFMRLSVSSPSVVSAQL